MSFSPLPFEVLGQVAPVLAWVEGDDGRRLPETWTTKETPFTERERGWILRELPTYSYDNARELVYGTRPRRPGRKPANLPRRPVEQRSPSLSPPPDYDLLEAFRRLNQHFFVWNGTEPCIREQRMEELHELALRLPAGHVVRHAHARTVSEGVLGFDEALDLPELVTLLPSNSFGLRSVVRKGLSESHLHLKGVISAEETWADNLLKPLSAQIFRGNSQAERRLLRLNLFAGRLLALAVWMSLVESEKRLAVEPRKLLRLLDQIYFARSEHEAHWATRKLGEALRRAIYGREDRCDGLINQPMAERERYEFLLRWMAPTGFHLQKMRRGVLPGRTPELLQDRHRFVHQLHLAAHLRLVQLTPRRAAEEDRQQERGRGGEKRGDELAPKRHFLHEALFRYLVCRTHHWQLTTQQGRTTGLRYFREYYGSRQRRPSGLTEMQYAELVFERLRKWRGLRVLEGRVSPPRRARELMPWILAHTRPEDPRIRKFGLVVHFKKEDEDKEERGFSTEVPAPVPRLRWGKRRRLLREEAKSLYRLLKRPTPIAPFVVGIDACNLELSTPPEVFAPVFRFLRELPISLSGGSWRHSPYFHLEPAIRRLVQKRRLGMTYHVGEDFRHLLSGLRAICEVVDFLAPRPGDRLGHGTALALQPKDWLEHNGYQAVLPRLEWLDTLVWVHHFLGPGDDLVGELEIEDQIQRLAWQIYSQALGDDYDPLQLKQPPLRPHPSREESRWEDEREPNLRGLLDWDWSPLALWDAWRLRQLDPYSLDLMKLLEGKLELRPPQGFCEEDKRWHSVQERVMREVKEEVGSRNAFLLLAFYWMSSSVRKEGAKIELIDMQRHQPAWLELCCRVEDKMKELIHRRELVVEVNPSSNRIIGPMERYRQHHAFHLTLDAEQRLSRQVRVSVNTDNPAVCNTTLAHEHYLLGEILIQDGVPEAEVVKWLEWLRSNGEQYNFVQRLKSPDEDPDMDQLVKWLRGIRATVREERTPGRKHDAFWCWRRDTRLRSLGFKPEVIAADPGALERLVALESQLRKLRCEGSPPPDLGCTAGGKA